MVKKEKGYKDKWREWLELEVEQAKVDLSAAEVDVTRKKLMLLSAQDALEQSKHK